MLFLTDQRTMRPISFISAAALVSTSLLQACAHNQPLELDAQAPLAVDENAQTMQILDELFMLFLMPEPDAANSLLTRSSAPAPSVGPELVAGDWLAWQCAISSNYWDLSAKIAPVQPEATDSIYTKESR